MSKQKFTAWVEAARLRTLPLALSGISLGGFLAAFFDTFNFLIFLFTLITAFFLQILSNFANDLGDTVNGADSQERQGPVRAVQSGVITVSEMKGGIIVTSVITLVSGIFLLWLSFAKIDAVFLFFLLLGLAAIGASIKYTVGKKPYGYAGFGDLFVFFFFGMVSVLGSFYLQAGFVHPGLLLPAFSAGVFSVAVLNINNIRDIKSDRLAGKNTIPVRLGERKAKFYHLCLLGSGFLAALFFIFLYYKSSIQLLFILSIPVFLKNGSQVWEKSGFELDPLLKQMAISTLLFVLLFGIGLIIVS